MVENDVSLCSSYGIKRFPAYFACISRDMTCLNKFVYFAIGVIQRITIFAPLQERTAGPLSLRGVSLLHGVSKMESVNNRKSFYHFPQNALLQLYLLVHRSTHLSRFHDFTIDKQNVHAHENSSLWISVRVP